MFVFSLKISKNKILIAIGAVVCILLLAFLLLFNGSAKSSAESSNGKYNLNASNNKERVAFFSQFGWNVNEEPLETIDVVIPSEFNETYENYNNIQKDQGLDLSRYKGKECKRWTYEINNYPRQGFSVMGNILVFNNKVIGGDICSAELNGFMHGFEKPKDAPSVALDENEPKQKEVAGQSDEVKSTARETLSPDPKMPQAPTD